MKRYWHGYIQPGLIATAHLAGWAKGWVGSVSRGRMGERCQRAMKWWQPQCTVRHVCISHGMKRVDKVWDVPERQTVHVDLVDTSSSVKQACRDLGLRVEACNIAASVVNSSLPCLTIMGLLNHSVLGVVGHSCFRKIVSYMCCFLLEDVAASYIALLKLLYGLLAWVTKFGP